MCGLVGLWTPDGAPAAALHASVTAMADALAHRGPDDAGIWSDAQAGLALGHRRLAIRDRSNAGHQPMVSASGRHVMVFNGEIDNHRQLRRELEGSGLLQGPWHGHSDTETLLASIEAWGLRETLRRCAGMFALAIWDRRRRRLLLARDRFGEKPLYVGLLAASTAPGRGGLHCGAAAQSLVFASDLAALRALPGAGAPTIDPSGLAAFLRFGCIPAPLTIERGIRQLAPGHWLQLSASDLCGAPAADCLGAATGCAAAPALPASKPWWDSLAASAACAADGFDPADPGVALDALEAVLRAVVAEQSLADVPLGSFLSGGLDSSLITALLQRTSSRPVRSFTVSFPDAGGGEAGFDEAPYARAVARHLGTDHSEVPLTAADAQALIPRLPQLWSEPFADSSQIPTHLVCREARRSGLSVVLSGDGGDELFGGYNRHRLAPALQRRFGAWPPLLRRGLCSGVALLPVSSRGLARDKRRKLAEALAAAASLDQLQAALTSVWPDPAQLLTPDWAHAAAAAAQPLLPDAPSPAERLMLADLLTYLPADILVKVDRAAMAVGLETRAPFLDHRVASLAWRLPLAFKIPPGSRHGKWALRQLLARSLPLDLIERPKAGFAIPIGAWLRGPLRSWASDLLDPALIRRQGYLRPEPIERLWQQHLAGQADHTPQLWTVLMWQAWLAEWTTGC